MNQLQPVRFGAIILKDYQSSASMYAANTVMRLKLTEAQRDQFQSVVDSQGEVEFFIDKEDPRPSLSVTSPNLNRNERNWWTNNHFKWNNRSQVEKLAEFLDFLKAAPVDVLKDARPNRSPKYPLSASISGWAEGLKTAYKNSVLDLAINKLSEKTPTQILDFIYGTEPGPS